MWSHERRNSRSVEGRGQPPFLRTWALFPFQIQEAGGRETEGRSGVEVWKKVVFSPPPSLFWDQRRVEPNRRSRRGSSRPPGLREQREGMYARRPKAPGSLWKALCGGLETSNVAIGDQVRDIDGVSFRRRCQQHPSSVFVFMESCPIQSQKRQPAAVRRKPLILHTQALRASRLA